MIKRVIIVVLVVLLVATTLSGCMRMLGLAGNGLKTKTADSQDSSIPWAVQATQGVEQTDKPDAISATPDSAQPETSGEITQQLGEDVQGVNAMLSGYPLDTAPIYEPTYIYSCSFCVDQNGYTSLGKNYYEVYYYTDASFDELWDFYYAMMDVEYESKEYGSCWGMVGESRVEVSLYEYDDEVSVRLYAGVPEDQWVAENPYYQLSMRDYVSLPREYSLTTQTFELSETYRDSGVYQAHYIEAYDTDLPSVDVNEFYSGQYDDLSQFYYSEGDYSFWYSWSDQDCNMGVYISKETEYSNCYLSIDLTTEVN